jgi:peptidoglycan/xylan/chitin deacetylase (PgdA/CDA1 family)
VPKVTLTFDNGPDPRVTPYVLDTLAHHNAKATFFVLGEKVSTRVGTGLAQRARREGHWIGNHTYTHSRPLGLLDEATALQEIERTEQALAWLEEPEFAQPLRLFRPYGGAGEIGAHLLQPALISKLETGGYTCVLWNSVPGDWHNPKGWVERALADCATRDWSLTVLHDLPTSAMSQLSRFLGCLKEGGFELVQEFPPDCVPIDRGKVVLPIERYVPDPAA